MPVSICNYHVMLLNLMEVNELESLLSMSKTTIQLLVTLRHLHAPPPQILPQKLEMILLAYLSNSRTLCHTMDHDHGLDYQMLL